MPAIAIITVPRDAAFAYARRTDARTAKDLGYVAKNVLSECYGDGYIRPYRVLDDGTTLKMIGFTPDGSMVQASKTGAAVTSEIRFSTWVPEKGSEILLDILVCPMESVTKGANGGRSAQATRPGRAERDVADARKFTSPLTAYSDWLKAKLSQPNSGCIPIGFPRFIRTEKFEAMRKKGEWLSEGLDTRETVMVPMPLVHAEVKVRVVNPPALEQFLKEGLGRQRAFGFGLAIPREVLNEFAN